MSELDDIRAIVEVIGTGGFARAARRLGVSKSIVSRRISRLETDLGAQLLNRTTRGIHATEAGLEFKMRGERILDELVAARDAVTQRNGEIAGRLRLSLPFYFGIRFMTPILAELSSANPRLEIDVSYSDHHVDLLNDRYDATIMLGALLDSTLIARRIAPVHVVVVASPDYLAGNGSPSTPDDLARHQCLLYSGRRERAQWQFQVGRHLFPVTPAGRFQTDNVQALLQAAEAGLGIAALPTFMVADGVRSGRLVQLLAEFALPEEGLFVVRPPGAYVSGKVRAFTDLIVKRFDHQSDWNPWPTSRQATDAREAHSLMEVGGQS